MIIAAFAPLIALLLVLLLDPSKGVIMMVVVVAMAMAMAMVTPVAVVAAALVVMVVVKVPPPPRISVQQHPSRAARTIRLSRALLVNTKRARALD